jgi:hypothetical protein
VKLFAKDPIAASRDSKVKLTERLAAAELAIIEKKEAAKKLAVDSADDDALDKAEAAVRAARDRVDTLSVAIQEVEQTIARLEAEQAKAADDALRAKTVVELEAISRDLTKAADDFDFASNQLAKIAERIGLFIPEGMGLAHFCQAAKFEVPPTIILLKTVLQSYASGVVAGGGPATLPKPAAPPLPSPPKPEMVVCHTIKKVAWTVDGLVRTSSPGYAIELSPAVAHHALKIGAVVQRDDPRAKFHADQRSPYTPLLENCTPLDHVSRAAVAAAIAEPRGIVEPIRRSRPPGILDAALPPRQLAAARNVPGLEIIEGKPYKVMTPGGNPQPPGPKGNGDE